MSHFYSLEERMDEVAKQYFALTQDASDHLEAEVKAIKKLQSVYRASKIRKCWHSVMGSTLLIQRALRGWIARHRVKVLRFEKQRSLNVRFFHHCAAIIQKFFRGWWSRRHLHDFHGRKRYLKNVEQRGDWTKEYLSREHQVNLENAKIEEEQRMRQEFDHLAGELHHLVSTKTTPGVYNPPYNDTLPRAFEKPIEQHLRDSCRVQIPKSLRRPRHRIAMEASPVSPHRAQMGASHAEMHAAAGGMTSSPPQDLPSRQPLHSRSASVGRMQKIQGPFRSKEQIEVANMKAATVFKTVQASGPYNALAEDQRVQQRISKLVRVSPLDFRAPGYPPEKAPPSSVHASVPYRDRPIELRGDYVELPKIRDKPPFFTALQHDRKFEDYNDHFLLPNGHI